MLPRAMGRCGELAVIFIVCISTVICKETSENHKPKFNVDKFHGIIEENSDIVNLKPALVATDEDEGVEGQICRFFIQEDNIPFILEVLDKTAGTGRITAKSVDISDCETNKEWKFHVRAEDCADPPRRSHGIPVHILVNDSNDNNPKFKSTSYETTVQEGAILTNFLKVEATDADCSDDFSVICNYTILTPNVPFQISPTGFISSIKELLSPESKTYIFEIQAVDCGRKTSDPVMVTVHVDEVCTPGWKGVPKRIETLPDTDSQLVAPLSFLETCGVPQCNTSRITTTLTLQTEHIGFGCDRETYSLHTQRTMCNAPSGAIDLLPTPSVQEKWTENLSTDEGHESDQIFYFDGKDDVAKIPTIVAPKNLTDKFSISFWMKHKPRVGGDKEYILANTDSEGVNRRHYAVFVHNCRLAFLIRNEHGETEKQYPTEYRWKLDQTCDKQWHRYTINVETQEVDLFVDGLKQESNRILEDWSLQTSGEEVTTLTVGASWDGGSERYSGYFKGYLASLSIVPGSPDSESVISCMFDCKEGLTIEIGDLPVQAAHLNPEKTQLTLEGALQAGFSDVLRKVSYFNHRSFPTPGSRDLTIETTAMCDENEIAIATFNTYVVILQLPEPTITISGSEDIAFLPNNYHTGIRPLASLTIISEVTEEEEIEAEEELKEAEIEADHAVHGLDSCTILSDSALSDHEMLTIPQGTLKQYQISVATSEHGMFIRGVASIPSYQTLLQAVIYTNTDDSQTPPRTLSVSCSELNGRFLSNTHDIQMNVLIKQKSHVSKSNPIHAKSLKAPNHIQHKNEMGPHIAAPKHIKQDSVPAMTMVLVVCVGFFMFLIVLGVFRVYTTRKVNRALEHQDMDWDDGPLNITVNPMEGPMEPVNEDSSDDDYDDDDCSEISSSSEEEIDCVEYKGTPLEWDDTTLKF